MTFYDFMTMCGSFGFIKEEYFGGKNVQIILYIYIYIYTHMRMHIVALLILISIFQPNTQCAFFLRCC